MTNQYPSDLACVAKVSDRTRHSIEALHKPNIKKLEKRKARSSFKESIWGADLVDLQVRSKYDKGLRFLLFFIDSFSKYAWFVPLKDQKGVTVTNAFQKTLDKSSRKPNKIWVHKESGFYNKSMKSQ